MDWYISLSLGEIFLKGKNRKSFVKKAMDGIKRGLKNFNIEEIYFEQGKIYIKGDKKEYINMIDHLKMVFGIDIIYRCIRVEKDLEEIKKGLIKLLEDKKDRNYTFKVKANRSDKNFPIKSPQLNADLGGFLLENMDNLRVDVHNPEIEVKIEIRNKVYLSIEKILGSGGLPIGSSNKGLVLLSGGIDSPVASYEISKRGMDVDFLYFNSFPFTSQRAEDKAKRLAKRLSLFIGPVKYYSVNLLPTYRDISKKCKKKFTTILARRMMMRIGEKISKDNSYKAMVTGESLGQVASQTVESIDVVNRASDILILRPLITRDKSEIIEIAKKIGTYDISIEPYLDSCSYFAPERPVTRPRLSDILEEEKKLDIDSLIEESMKNMEIIEIDGED